MPSPVQDLLNRYECRTTEDYRHALQEIIQEITLLGLSRAGFFRKGVLYGETALRIFHGQEYVSEDLAFTLNASEPEFEIEAYTSWVRDELAAYGFAVQFEKQMSAPGSQAQFLKIASLKPPVSGVAPNEQLKIKFEVDTDPPAGAGFEVKYQLRPIPYSVRLYDLPSLFAGKLHAVLCRAWKNRVKGRDFYDYLWYLSHGVHPNLPHLEARMRQSGHWISSEALDGVQLRMLLEQRFSQVDFGQAAEDVRPFIRDPRSLDLWSGDFFTSVTKDKLRV